MYELFAEPDKTGKQSVAAKYKCVYSFIESLPVDEHEFQGALSYAHFQPEQA